MVDEIGRFDRALYPAEQGDVTSASRAADQKKEPAWSPFACRAAAMARSCDDPLRLLASALTHSGDDLKEVYPL